jgi:hypothetical protein
MPSSGLRRGSQSGCSTYLGDEMIQKEGKGIVR